MANAYVADYEEKLRRRAQRHTIAWRSLYVHLAVYVVAIVVLVAVNSVVLSGRPWLFVLLIGWGIGLALHGIVVALFTLNSKQAQRMQDRELQAFRTDGNRRERRIP